MIIYGDILADKIISKLHTEIQQLAISPGLAVITIGDDPASRIYVKNKEKACNKCGIIFYHYILPENVTEKKLLHLIKKLNRTKRINGIICQLPVPKHINVQHIIEAISPEKDVDGFSRLSENYNLYSCTPKGILEIFKRYNIEVAGKHCVVIGRSNIVGKPMARLLLKQNATVTICHSHTQDLCKILKTADIIISAAGQPNLIKEYMIPNDVTIIDVGINRTSQGKICGDVDFKNCSPKAKFITPVPGGIGPMTVASLMQNVFIAYLNQCNH